jgi:DNA-directed RNA polymerase subunit alpha
MDVIPLPNRVALESQEGNRYTFVIEPLYPGYGTTVGNALRRVLMSSMPGAAITAVKMKWVDHEFQTVPNVKEDVIQIILNLKRIRLRVHTNEPVRLQLKVKGEKEVTAADIKGSDLVEVVNPDLHIATLDNKNSDFDLELIVQQGRGYVPVEQREDERLEVGMVAIDAIFTPIRNVSYDVTNVRVGQITNFDKVTLSVETDGTMTGQQAIDIAARILVDHFNMLFSEGSAPANATTAAELPSPASEEEVVESAGTPIRSLNLSVRAENALEKNGILTIEQLNSMDSEEIKNLDGLGEKSVKEILEAIGK